MCVAVLLGSLVHGLLDGLEHIRNGNGNAFECCLGFLTVVAAHQHAAARLDILRSELDAKRHAAHLTLRKLEAGTAICVVHVDAYACRFKLCRERLRPLQNAFLVHGNRDNP